MLTMQWNVLWLTVGIALTTATQLRVGGGAIGPGEAMLVVWILFTIGRVLVAQHHLISPVVKAVLLFWITCCIALALGVAIASSKGIAAVEADINHNMQALLLASLFSLLFTISFTSVQPLKQGLACFTTFVTISLGVLFFFPSILPLVSARYADARFTGWSLNPNQTALSLLFVPFFTLYLLQANQSLFSKIWYGLLTAGAVSLGISTRSDALNIAWGIGMIVLVMFAIDRFSLSLFAQHHYSPVRRVIYRLLTRLFLLMSALSALPILYYAVSSTAVEVYDEGGQGGSRLRLWMNGLAALSRSPLFGLGPGSHSGGIAPFLSMECHNTFIDWATNTGIVGLISYVSLLVWIGWITWRKELPILFAGVIASVGFVSFHYVLRQPIYWFGLLAIAEMALLTPRHQHWFRQTAEPARDAEQIILTHIAVSEKISRSTGS
ncbi:MAG: hypothetical protein Kow00121_01360 [Elainellaceae cyanobacterium]